MQKTSSTLKNKLDINFNTRILSDSATQFIVASHLGLRNSGTSKGWIKPELLKNRIENIGGIDQVNAKQDIICILSIDERIKSQVGTSFIGRMSNHWSEDFTKML